MNADPRAKDSWRASGRQWPWIIVGLLVGNAIIAGTLVVTAERSRPHVVADYYRKALAHDAVMAQARRNVALGWRAAITLDGPTGRLEVALTDADGRAVDGATVRVELFHRAHPADVVTGALTRVGPGTYQRIVAQPRPGVWQLALTAERAGDRFTVDRDVVVPTVVAALRPEGGR